MSPIGRILIVVNLLLAAAFLGWASQTLQVSQDYKTQLEELEEASAAAKQELEGELAAVRAQLDEQRRTAASSRQDADAKGVQIETLQSQLADAEADNDDLRGQIESMKSNLADLARSVDNASERATKAAAEARQADTARLEAEQAQLEAQAAMREAELRAELLSTELAETSERVVALQLDLATTKNKLGTVAAMTGIDINAIDEAPPLDTSVAAAQMDLEPGFVSILAGSSDGVQRGTVFDIYRGATYKGQVRVVEVTESACSAVVMTRVEGTTITAGDSATTAL